MTSPHTPPETDERDVRQLYQGLIAAWNRRDVQALAAAYCDDATFVGFDGSHMQSRSAIERVVRGIFADGPTGTYVPLVREIRFLRADVALVRSVVGRIPPGASDPDPALNAIQSLVAVKQAGHWRIALFQNTPVAAQGRPHGSRHLAE